MKVTEPDASSIGETTTGSCCDNAPMEKAATPSQVGTQEGFEVIARWHFQVTLWVDEGFVVPIKVRRDPAQPQQP